MSSDGFLTDLPVWLAAAGVPVVEYDGWADRARSSGGYASGRPWGVMWHHTASTARPEDDAAYCCHVCDYAPVCNLLVDRDGVVWVLAAGATNTNGSGGPWTWSRGTVPADAMNTHAVGIEIANAGTGEPYPAVQIDAAFAASLAIIGGLGLDVADVCTHHVWAPTRKIDPATADAVSGGWRPGAVTSSGTWSLADLVDEHKHRAGAAPPPQPQGDDDMAALGYYRDDRADGWQIWVVALDDDGAAWCCPINDLPDAGSWDVVSPIVGDPPTRPFAALCGLMDRQNRPG
jgi:N-acetylmuramoyl-L-alanine amidase